MNTWADSWDVGGQRLAGNNCGLAGDRGDNCGLAGDLGHDGGHAGHDAQGVGLREVHVLWEGVD